MANVKIGIIDDGYPTFDHRMSLEEISELTVKEDWASETGLQELNIKLISQSLQLKRKIHVEAFKHPNFYFNAEDDTWDYLIYDWEYKPETNSDNDLLTILSRTNCPIYIYSAWDKIDRIPEILAEERFTPFTGRYEILNKGEKTSEEKILEDVMRVFREGEDVEWKNNRFKLFPSKYVVDMDDFWKLQFLLGAEQLNDLLSKTEKVDEGKIFEFFEQSKYKFFIDAHKTVLSSSNSELIQSFVGQLTELTMLDTLKAVGIDKMEKAKEKGYTEIK